MHGVLRVISFSRNPAAKLSSLTPQKVPWWSNPEQTHSAKSDSAPQHERDQASKSHRLPSFTHTQPIHSATASYVSGSGCLPRTKRGRGFLRAACRSHELANEINERAGGAKALARSVCGEKWDAPLVCAMLWQLQQWASFLSINGMKLEKNSAATRSKNVLRWTQSIRLRKC